MQLLHRRFVKVGLFLAALMFLFIGSDIHAPVAYASGEYYQYIKADDTIRMTGGILGQGAAGLQRVGPLKFTGGITVPGQIARIGTGLDPTKDPKMQGTCSYSISVDLKADPASGIPGALAGGDYEASEGFPADFFGNPVTTPGECRSAYSWGSADQSMQGLIDTNQPVHLAADARGSAGGNACPGSNAPAGTDCSKIPLGCPGSTATGTPPTTPPTNCQFQAVAGTDSAEEPDLCPVEKGTALRWIACPIVAAGESITNILDSTINYFLTINTDQIFGTASGGSTSNPGDPTSSKTSSGFYQAWTSFRNLGLGLVVIAGIVMIMSEALGLQIVDAYTVRKVLPRLLIAVIGISLSWSLMYFLITLFNRLGTGMSSLIYSSFAGVGANNATQTGAVFAQYFGLAGGLLALGVLGILSFLGTLILALIVGIAVLILREGIIIMSVIIAPLAIASYVLPNTSKFANFWWSTFFKALMAFPIITGFIAICKVMALISNNI